MTLREQVSAIGREAIGDEFVEATAFPRLVDYLCRKAFVESWEESAYTRALRRAARLLDNGLYVSESEGSVS